MVKKYLFVVLLLLIINCEENHDLREAQLEILFIEEAAEGFNESQKNKYVLDKDNIFRLEEYDLGNIPESKSKYFLIINRGEETALDVEIELVSNLQGISLSKTNFLEIPAFQDLGYDELLSNYLFRVDIEHGGAAKAEEEIILQPMGLQFAMLVANSEKQALYTESRINFNILLAELKVVDENGEVLLDEPTGSTWTGGFEAGTFVPDFKTGQNARVINSGNIDLPIQVFNTISWKTDYILAPGDSINVLGDRTVTIALKETEAVRDREKFPVISNNKCYFALDRR